MVFTNVYAYQLTNKQSNKRLCIYNYHRFQLLFNAELLEQSNTIQSLERVMLR